MPSTPVVAFLGTGTMGAPMVSNLLRAGLTVRVWNRTAEKARPLADEGAELAADPADAVRGADVVVTMLDAADAVRQTIAAAAPGIRCLRTAPASPAPAPLPGSRRPAASGDR